MMSAPTSKRYGVATPGMSRSRLRAVLRWLRIALLYLAVLAGLTIALGPTGPSIDQALAAGDVARATYRYDRALSWYATAGMIDPTDPRPACRAGTIYLLQQEYAAARDAYEQCAARQPTSATAWLGVGDAWQALGNVSAAQSAWRRSMRNGGQVAIGRLAHVAEQEQRFGLARSLWEQLPRSNGEALMHLGLIALWNGEYAQASADFLALRAVPNQWANQVTDDGFVELAARPLPGYQWQTLLGYKFLAAGMPSFAIEPLRAAIAAAPSFGDARAYLGWALWQTGQKAEAQQQIADGLRLSPKLSFALFAAGQLAASEGNNARARSLYQRALSLDARNPVLWEAFGQEELASLRFISASLALRNAAQFSSDPRYIVAYLRLFTDYHYGLTDGSAQAAIIFALQRAPRVEPVLFQIGLLYHLLANETDAFYTFEQARALDPTDAGPYVMLGEANENGGNYVAAALDLRTALALRPNGPYAAKARALLAPIAGAQV